MKRFFFALLLTPLSAAADELRDDDERPEERTARGGREGATYIWGDSYDPVEGWLAKSWQGSFPVDNETLDGHYSTAPVG